MPPAVADEGQKSIMSFFKKVDLKSAATATPAASSGAGSKSPSAQECADLSSAATPTVAQKVVKTPAAVYPGSAGSSAEKKGKRKSDSNSSSSAKSAKSARESQKDTATSSRPSRASKSRAQEQLKERDYSSDSLMEESEDEAEAAAHTRDTAEEQEEKTPAAASSLRRGGRKVRFSIDGEDELEKAVGGDFSPIAINDDDDVECLGDVVDTDKQEAERVARQRAALDAVEGELTTLQYDKGASKIENASVVETPKVDVTTPKSTSNSKAPATKKGGSHSKKGSGAMEAAPTRRSSRGSGTGGKGKDAVEEEKEEEKGDRGNIFDRMKTWKKNQEHKEEKKWEEAIVDLEEKIENGEADDSLTVEAEEALHEVAKEEEEAVAAAAAAEEEEDEDDEEMSSYEKERLANIKRNNAFLLNLGIDTVAVPVTPKTRPPPKSRRRERSPPTPGSALPTRRSTRAASGDVLLKSKMQELESLEGQLAEYKESGATEGETEEYLVEQIAELKAEIAGIEEENAAKRAKLTEENESVRARGRGWREEEEEEVELSFDDSSVKRYECESVRRRVDMADLSKGVRGLAPIEDATYVDGNLKKIYSISFRPCGKLVAAAGHGGMAGIFGIGHGGAGGEDVLLSWKAHQGWIGDIQFGSQQKEDASSNLVLSTSNDKMVILWDINTAASAGRQVIPKKVASASWHSSGVFSMHEVDGSIVTGSKDGAVVVAKLTESTLSKVRALEDILDGHVVKCVRLRPNTSASVFACGGNSHTVRIMDVREGGGGGLPKGGTTLHAADSAVSFVQWSPVDENVLISCSHDTDIKLWDIRKSKEAVHSLVGHHLVPKNSRIKGMHRATFFAGGRYVVSTGDKTDLISIYDVATGTAVSRGAAEGTGTASTAFEDNDCCLVAVAAASTITLYTPLPLEN